MNKQKTLLYLIFFVLLILTIRIIWISSHENVHSVEAEAGVLHLDAIEGGIFSLEGEWEYYDQQFIEPFQANQSEASYVRSFDRWPYREGFQYGTYRLEITLNEEDVNQLLGLKLPNIYTSYRLYLNGEQLIEIGQVAKSALEYEGSIATRYVTYNANDTNLELLLHVAHDHVKGRKGGIYHPLEFGDGDVIQRQEITSIVSQIAVIVIFIIHGLYGFILYVVGPKQKVLLYFGALLFVAAVSVMFSDHRVILYLIPLPYEYISKLIFLSFSASILFLVLFCKHLFPTLTNGILFRLLPKLIFVYCLFIILAPIEWVISTRIVINMILIIVPAAVIFVFLKTVIQGLQDNIFILFGATALAVHISSTIVQYNLGIDLDFYPIDFTLAVILFSIYCFKRYFRSVEQTKTLSKQLQRSLRSKDDFLANTSHELRNPLHGMINIAQTLLEKEKHDKEEYKERLQLLINVGQRMSFLINDLLEVNHLNENQMTLKKKPINVHSIIVGVIDLLKFLVNGKEIHFQILVPQSFPSVLADEHRLTQILFNIIHNAIKYTEVGTITITADREDKQALIHVSDTGIGISNDEIERIFQRYEQGDYSTAVVGGGIGLGLSITKQLVELHGGTVSVQSIRGKGTTFTFSMPIAQDTQPSSLSKPTNHHVYETSQTASHSLDHQENGRILIVDDDPINITIVEELLNGTYATYGVSSGAEALKHLNEENWDLIITDVMMPYMSGYELTRQIRDTYLITELPILILTARSQTADIQAAFHAGANDYVTKPVNAQELRSRVSALIRVKKTVEENVRIETAWLQAQIQPHFFFNTLNAILSLAEFDTSRMKKLLEEFCYYLQTSFQFNNSAGLVSVENELRFVQSYMFIMQERAHTPFSVKYDIDEQVKEWGIPPFSIQPLVENAIEHGLMKEKEGSITISLKCVTSDTATVTISDNGCGIPNDKAVHLLNKPPSQEKRGIGLYNVNRRLKQQTGQGLTIKSEGKGTTIQFTIKATSQQ
ncbi:ATP-binding protein [Halalkalibacter sp. APA_J-10(15)]|uniref:hybrid sensor histidine kinase/response regulator n=1 Tax=Halalkalibacter sp. APA_J-10(15) TaxID=2933805 RepID=UPI001FF45495|nr:ATP-binding protein [Halalkalibacter sp. APA_J-10(15)]MCK0470165.1 ATP-binding protein [Halalkalibacter sp. APA_J-10(15)]